MRNFHNWLFIATAHKLIAIRDFPLLLLLLPCSNYIVLYHFRELFSLYNGREGDKYFVSLWAPLRRFERVEMGAG